LPLLLGLRLRVCLRGKYSDVFTPIFQINIVDLFDQCRQQQSKSHITLANIMKEKTLIKITLITLLICSYCNAQTSDFIVTTSKDTIYVDKINLTDFEVKTKKAEKKKNYNFDLINSYYLSKEKKYYERILLEKKEHKDVDRYDYRRNENLYLEEYKSRIKYKFIERLTVGKVKLFIEVLNEAAVGSPNQPGFIAAQKNEIYYISVYDSKLELIRTFGTLKLTKDVYELLKVYLHGDDEITKKLDQLILLNPKADKEQIINLINEYNSKINSNK
jgi:hypothetical protein